MRNSVAAPDGPPGLVDGSVSVAPGGPLLLSGTKAALCRRGHSGRRPFCDASHKAARFEG